MRCWLLISVFALGILNKMQWRKGKEGRRERKEAMENICFLQSHKKKRKKYLIDLSQEVLETEMRLIYSSN